MWKKIQNLGAQQILVDGLSSTGWFLAKSAITEGRASIRESVRVLSVMERHCERHQATSQLFERLISQGRDNKEIEVAVSRSKEAAVAGRDEEAAQGMDPEEVAVCGASVLAGE